ncbi:MAG: APC family permease [Candidatus Thorarchaeota archaeon]|nr:APC family permease [Candidatus Thorarchaeota archaeon]
MSDDQLLFVRESSGLVKEVGPWFALLLPIALTVGPYFHFVAPQVSTWFAGAHLVPVFAVGTFAILFEGIGTMCLMLAMPRSGASYHFVGRGLSPIFGVMEGWRSVITNPVFRGSASFFSAKVAGGGFQAIGIIANNDALLALGNALSNDVVVLVVVALILTFIGFIFSYLSVKILGWFVVILGLIVIVLLLISDIILIATPITNTSWDALFAGTGHEVADLQAGSWITDINAYNTLSLTAVAGALVTAVGIMWPYLIMPVAGEVSQPSRNIPLSCMGGVIGIGGLFMLSAYAVEVSMGELLYWNNSSTAGIFPGFGNFAAIALGPGGAALGAILVLQPILANTLDGPSNALWVTRPFHAMAMDRMCPEAMAQIHPKYHVPHNSLYFWLIVQIIIIVMAVWYDVSIAIGVAFTYVFIRWQFTLAEVALPYYRPTLWERSGAWTLLGVPLVSIAGLISGAVFFYALISFVPSSTVQFETLFTVVVYFWGQLMYMYYGAKNKAKGVDMAAIFGQLPPE